MIDDLHGQGDAPLLFRAVNLGEWDLVACLLKQMLQPSLVFLLLGSPSCQIRAPKTTILTSRSQNTDCCGYSILHYACWDSAAPKHLVQQLMAHSPRDGPACQNRQGRTPLHVAAWHGSDAVLDLLVRECPWRPRFKIKTADTL